MQQFTPEQLKAIEMLATPGKKITHVKICEEIGVSVQTLYRWRQQPEFINAVNQLAYELLRGKLPEVYDALAEKAAEGNTKAIELMLKYAGNYVEKSEQKISGGLEIKVGFEEEEENIEE